MQVASNSLRSRRQPLPSDFSPEAEEVQRIIECLALGTPQETSPHIFTPSCENSEIDCCCHGTAGVVVPLDETDFECALCCRLLYKPVTTICGHTYCKACIGTSLLYSLTCPICRRKLCDKAKDFDCAINFTLTTILEKHFTKLYKLREEEEKHVPSKVLSKDGDTEEDQSELSPSCTTWYWSALLCDV